MKRKLPLTLSVLFFLCSLSFAQDFELVYVVNGAESIKQVDNATAVNFTPDNNRVIKIIARSNDLKVFSDNAELTGQWKPRTASTFEFPLTAKAKPGKKLEVKRTSGAVALSFILPQPAAPSGGTRAPSQPPLTAHRLSPHEKAFENAYTGAYTITDYGITIDNNYQGGYEFGGPDYSHVFIDEFGNTIKTTTPSGLADQLYVVHIIYMVPKDEDFNKIYGIKPTRGRFNPALRGEATEKPAGILQSAEDFDIYEKTYLLRKSTDDIGFDLMRTDEDGTKTKIESFEIPMSPDYHWSLHGGLLNTWLSNPTYQVVADPQNPGGNVLKRSAAGNRGVVTVAATLYTSPFTLIRHGVQKRRMKKGKSVLDLKNPVPKSQKWAKNYLFERTLLDRFYPTIGVGLRDKTFENLFAGFNIEFARGGYVFAGVHYGKVNFFDKPAGFEYGKTPITQAEFDLLKDEKWRVNFALGVNIDFIILSGLFK
jgi:hypothetical protein